jgi:hypothetical protein
LLIKTSLLNGGDHTDFASAVKPAGQIIACRWCSVPGFVTGRSRAARPQGSRRIFAIAPGFTVVTITGKIQE